jgi:hypothetical protein
MRWISPPLALSALAFSESSIFVKSIFCGGAGEGFGLEDEFSCNVDDCIGQGSHIFERLFHLPTTRSVPDLCGRRIQNVPIPIYASPQSPLSPERILHPVQPSVDLFRLAGGDLQFFRLVLFDFSAEGIAMWRSKCVCFQAERLRRGVPEGDSEHQEDVYPKSRVYNFFR